MAGKKSPDVEISQRIDKVYELLINGAAVRHIWQFVQQKTAWGISYGQLCRYVKEAEKRLKEASKTHRENELGKSIEQLNSLYFKSLQIQDYKTCLAIRRELNHLLGLGLEEDLARRIEELEAQMGESR